MKSSLVKSVLATALVCGALVSGSASASEEQRFSALGGIEAQALSAQEMDAVHGALTASDIRTAYFAFLDRIAALNPTGIIAKNIDLLKARYDQYIMPRLVRIFG